MDYFVGSLADLISGSNTPNKPKVIKKPFKKENPVVKAEHNTQQVKKPKTKDIKPKSEVKKWSVVENKVKKNVKPKNHKIEEGSSPFETSAEKRAANNVTFKTQHVRKPKKDFKPKSEVKKLPLVENKVKKNFGSKKDKGNEVSSTFKTSAEQRSANNVTFNGTSNNRGKRSFEAVKTEPAEEEGSPLKKQKVNNNEQNAERRIKKKIKEENKIQDPEEEARTIFVGNVPITCDKKKIKQLFKKYGTIETIRIRGTPVADIKTPKKVAAIKKEFNPNRSNVFCFIRFADKESAEKAQAENGSLFQNHHLRVHLSLRKEKPDEAKAIFVGNLSFNATEDDLWKLFEPCGPIFHIRIVRDRLTGMGKGFGYVNFQDSDAVQLALEMENVKLNDRELRISLCNLNAAKKNKQNRNKKVITQPGKQKPRNKMNKLNKRTDGAKDKVKQINSEFQGSKFNDKKKHKVNKGLLEKKKLVKKIAPKPK